MTEVELASIESRLGLNQKSIEYMKTESRRVLATPADENSSFRAQDLNQAVSASRAMICSAVRLGGLRDGQAPGAH